MFVVVTEKDSSSTSSAPPSGAGGRLSKSSFLAGLHPSRWGNRSSQDTSSSSSKPAGMVLDRGVSTASLLASYRDRIKSWITTHGRFPLSEKSSLIFGYLFGFRGLG